MEYMEEKLENLRVRLKKTGRVAVAFSGGVDSAFLLEVAADTLGRENVSYRSQMLVFSQRILPGK